MSGKSDPIPKGFSREVILLTALGVIAPIVVMVVMMTVVQLTAPKRGVVVDAKVMGALVGGVMLLLMGVGYGVSIARRLIRHAITPAPAPMPAEVSTPAVTPPPSPVYAPNPERVPSVVLEQIEAIHRDMQAVREWVENASQAAMDRPREVKVLVPGGSGGFAGMTASASSAAAKPTHRSMLLEIQSAAGSAMADGLAQQDAATFTSAIAARVSPEIRDMIERALALSAHSSTDGMAANFHEPDFISVFSHRSGKGWLLPHRRAPYAGTVSIYYEGTESRWPDFAEPAECTLDSSGKAQLTKKGRL